MPGVKERPLHLVLAGLGQLLLRCLSLGIHALDMSTPLQACRPRLTAAQKMEGQKQEQGRPEFAR